MPLSHLAKSFFALTLCATATAAAAQEKVTFPSLDGVTTLTSYLSRPPGNMEGDAPRPALVLLHGCSGLTSKDGKIFATYRAWTRALLARGYVVLAVDSAASRGFGQTCPDTPERLVMWRNRRKDAFAALQYLQAQPFVKADQVGVMGWSQGGGTVLRTINDKSNARPEGLAHDFKTAVAFYPGACSERLQSKPSTEVEPQSWTTKIPMLVLFGEADTWTLFPPCAEFIESAKTRGSPIELKSYPNAYHAFDAPDIKRRERPEYRTGDGPIPIIATDEEARADAVLRVLAYLKAHLE